MTFPQNSEPQLLVITIKEPDGDNHRVIKTRDGKWKIPVFYPFNTKAKFGDTQEVIRADYMVRDENGNLVEFDFPPGQYAATVTRGDQKDGTDGGVSWNYYWKVSKIEIPNHAKNINDAGAEKDRRKPLENITKPDVQEETVSDKKVWQPTETPAKKSHAIAYMALRHDSAELTAPLIQSACDRIFRDITDEEMAEDPDVFKLRFNDYIGVWLSNWITEITELGYESLKENNLLPERDW